MFFLLSKTLDLLVSPLVWVLLLCVFAAIPWRARPRVRVWSRRAPWVAVSIVMVFACPAVANRLWRWLEAPAHDTMKRDVTYDAVIVLGGYVEPEVTRTVGSAAFNGNVERMLTAYDLVRAGKANAVLFSGGMDDPALEFQGDARLSAQQFVAWGVEGARVYVETKSRNTWENAQFSAEIVRAKGWKRVLLITSAFHMPRAEGCFRKAGLAVDTLPVDYKSWNTSLVGTGWLPRAGALEQSTAAIREWTGRAVYRLRGYSK